MSTEILCPNCKEFLLETENSLNCPFCLHSYENRDEQLVEIEFEPAIN